MPLFKKSGNGGLFKKAQTKKARRYGAPTEPTNNSVSDSGFPTSEDLRRGVSPGVDTDGDPDTRFICHGERRPVASSNVDWLQYDESTMTLHVGYQNGSDYYCSGVAPSTALQILHASSVGSALNDLRQTHGTFHRA